MPGIGKINSPGFNIAPRSMRMKGLSMYCLRAVTMKKLARTNMSVTLDPFRVECHPTNTNRCFANEVLFASQKSGTIFTDASACSSYILYCENAKIAAAVHVSPSYLTKPMFHLSMLLYGYTNLIKMAPKDTVSAYISGMEEFLDPNKFAAGRMLLECYRTIRTSVFPELTERGVEIKVLDVGKSYSRQELNLITGEYKVILETSK